MRVQSEGGWVFTRDGARAGRACLRGSWCGETWIEWPPRHAGRPGGWNSRGVQGPPWPASAVPAIRGESRREESRGRRCVRRSVFSAPDRAHARVAQWEPRDVRCVVSKLRIHFPLTPTTALRFCDERSGDIALDFDSPLLGVGHLTPRAFHLTPYPIRTRTRIGKVDKSARGDEGINSAAQTGVRHNGG